jgi:uncharacterized protein YprB with RNaseH-like and TPR domain
MDSVSKDRWTAEEIEIVERWFTNNWTILTCFQRILTVNPHRTYEGVARRIRRMRASGWTKAKDEAINKMRVGYLDIEATNLNADFGMILSWYIKKAGCNEYDCAIITQAEIQSFKFDYRVVKELLEALDNYDMIYVHYGSDRRFDIPYIRTRAYANGLENLLPERMEKLIVDTYPIARNKLKLHSNRLGSIADAVGIKGVKKTPLQPGVWRMASCGHEPSLQYIALHNKRDVQILERVHNKLKVIECLNYRGM